MKLCQKCNKNKNLSCFYFATRNKDGHQSYCKNCDKLIKISRGRSLEGKARQMYASMKNRLKNHSRYKNKTCCFSQAEFLEWVLNNKNYKKLHRAWADSGYVRKISPSLDRINSKGNYEFRNLQIISQHENSAKDLIGKTGKMSNRGKRVVCVKTRRIFPSATSAAKAYDISPSTISLYCLGYRKKNRFNYIG